LAVTVPPSPAAQARRDLGLRLRQIRKAAGLTGQMLATATGQHFTRISRIENGVQPPTDRNIADWCTACGAEEQIGDLIATAQVAESTYLDWARQSRAGLKHLGTLHSITTYRRTTSCRIHEPIVLPGIFQTDAYIRQMLGSMWNKDFAARVRIQYGGSMKPENAKGLLHQSDVDGGLIGGASLKPDSFLAIVNAAK